MLKRTIILSCLLSILFISSCKKEEKKDPKNPDLSESVDLIIKVNAEEALPPYEEFKVEITELRSLDVTEAGLDTNGVCNIELDKGTYSINVEWKRGNISFFGNQESYSLTKADTLEIPLTKTTFQPQGLIFKEVFFNGETNNGIKMHPDQYFVLYNNGDEVIYADGVTFGITAHANWAEADVFSEYLPENIIAAELYSIPGNGFDYPLEPGQQIVVAATAINHNADYPNSADLSGADFEAYEPEAGTDVDNPNVPNLIAHYSAFGRFIMHPKGPMVPFIFKPETDMETFMAENKLEFESQNGDPIFVYKVPAGLILDGIETGSEGTVTVKSLPLSIDRGYVTITGCHARQLIQRKVGEDGKLIDTNNSSADCERVKGQNSFPEGGLVSIFNTPKSKKIINNNIDNYEINQFKNSTWNVLN